MESEITITGSTKENTKQKRCELESSKVDLDQVKSLLKTPKKKVRFCFDEEDDDDVESQYEEIQITEKNDYF